MEIQTSSPQKSILKRWWFWLIIVILIAIGVIIFIFTRPGISDNPISQLLAQTGGSDCPDNIEGILTYPLIDLSKIGAMTPLGNLNPPGHTSPVDHIYFSANTTEKIPLYAPADATITNIIALYQDTGSGYEPRDFVVQYTICKGLILDFAGYTEIIQPIMDEIEGKSTTCKEGIVKEGHEGQQKQCGYNLSYKVTSGQLIGYTQAQEENGQLDLQFEIWAANYNEPAPSNIDWSFYNDERYAHIICPFDLYTGDMKQQFYDKLGEYQPRNAKDPTTGNVTTTYVFTPRTIEPICGTVNQNIVGTIQGMWFGEGWKTNHEVDFVDDSRQFSILHWNIDPTYAELGNAGEISDGNDGQVRFIPNHSGTIDREPSEVTADGNVYCYNYQTILQGQSPIEGKILIQLVDDTHLKLEYKERECSTSESFTDPYNYER